MKIDKRDIVTDNQLKEALIEAFTHYQQNHPFVDNDKVKQSVVDYVTKHFHINCNN